MIIIVLMVEKVKLFKDVGVDVVFDYLEDVW